MVQWTIQTAWEGSNYIKQIFADHAQNGQEIKQYFASVLLFQGDPEWMINHLSTFGFLYEISRDHKLIVLWI